MVIEFHLFITVWTEYRNLAPFAKRIVKFPEFEKMTEDQIFQMKKNTAIHFLSASIFHNNHIHQCRQVFYKDIFRGFRKYHS